MTPPLQVEERHRQRAEKTAPPHLVVDGDCWYSCPLALNDVGRSECCDDEAVARGKCTCGRDDFVERLALAFAEAEAAVTEAVERRVREEAALNIDAQAEVVEAWLRKHPAKGTEFDAVEREAETLREVATWLRSGAALRPPPQPREGGQRGGPAGSAYSA